MTAPKQFKPDYGIDGPARARRASRLFNLALAIFAGIGVYVTVTALLRLLGVSI